MNLTALIKEREEAFEKEVRKELQKTLNKYFPKVYEEGEAKKLMKRGEALVLYGEAVALSRKQNRTTIRKTLEAVREMCEGMKKNPTEDQEEGLEFDEGYDEALSDLSAHITEELDKMEEV